MIPPESEDAEAAQEIEITCPVAVIEIGSLPAAEADIVAHDLEHPHELLVAVTAVDLVAIGLVTCEQRGYVRAVAQ